MSFSEISLSVATVVIGIGVFTIRRIKRRHNEWHLRPDFERSLSDAESSDVEWMGLDASPAHGDGAERVISETCLYASPCRPDNTIFEEFDYTPTYPPDWDARKRAVKERDGYRCKILGCVITTDLEVHHRVPIRQRSDHRLKNLACLCQYHHYFVDREHEVVGERIDNDRYSAVQSFWRTNRRAGGSHRVERHVQRYIRASFSDLSEINLKTAVESRAKWA